MKITRTNAENPPSMEELGDSAASKKKYTPPVITKYGDLNSVTRGSVGYYDEAGAASMEYA